MVVLDKKPRKIHHAHQADDHHLTCRRVEAVGDLVT
jgi:hypothetical protein